MNKRQYILLLIILIFLLLINLLITKIVITNSLPCYLEEGFGDYVKGEIIIDFVQDITKEEVDSFLLSYGFSSYEIRYPEKNEYRIDFIGDKNDFLEYLNQSGFTREYSRVPTTYIFEAKEGINCEGAKEIAHNYKNATVTNVYCFGHVGGVVKVRKGTEIYWVCKLRKNELIEDTHVNGILHAY